VSNDLVSEPNATGTSNVTWQPSQNSEVVGTDFTNFSYGVLVGSIWGIRLHVNMCCSSPFDHVDFEFNAMLDLSFILFELNLIICAIQGFQCSGGRGKLFLMCFVVCD
jgi:hypothetical protein